MAKPSFFLCKLISAMKNHKWRWNDTCLMKIGGVKYLLKKNIHCKGPIATQERWAGKKFLLKLQVNNIPHALSFSKLGQLETFNSIKCVWNHSKILKKFHSNRYRKCSIIWNHNNLEHLHSNNYTRIFIGWAYWELGAHIPFMTTI